MTIGIVSRVQTSVGKSFCHAIDKLWVQTGVVGCGDTSVYQGVASSLFAHLVAPVLDFDVAPTRLVEQEQSR